MRRPDDEGSEGEPYSRRQRGTRGTDLHWPPGSDVDFRRMVYKAYGRADTLQREEAQGEPPPDYTMDEGGNGAEEEVDF